jgi:predicted O-linked N-acetylglucosamine transferase (SPINDLY family)
LVTDSLGDYEARAIALLRDGASLSSVRTRLQAARATHAYFNTEHYCRRLEAAYTAMHGRAQQGLAPECLAFQ